MLYITFLRNTKTKNCHLKNKSKIKNKSKFNQLKDI